MAFEYVDEVTEQADARPYDMTADPDLFLRWYEAGRAAGQREAERSDPIGQPSEADFHAWLGTPVDRFAPRGGAQRSVASVLERRADPKRLVRETLRRVFQTCVKIAAPNVPATPSNATRNTVHVGCMPFSVGLILRFVAARPVRWPAPSGRRRHVGVTERGRVCRRGPGFRRWRAGRARRR